MAIVNKEELIERIRSSYGDAPTDDNLSIIEDITDSWDEHGTDEERIRDAVENAVEENEKKWRKRYADRFLGKKMEREEEIIERPDGNDKIRIKDLFEYKKEDEK